MIIARPDQKLNMFVGSTGPDKTNLVPIEGSCPKPKTRYVLMHEKFEPDPAQVTNNLVYLLISVRLRWKEKDRREKL